MKTSLHFMEEYNMAKTQRYENGRFTKRIKQVNPEFAITERYYALSPTSRKGLPTKRDERLLSPSYKNLKVTLQQLEDKVRDAHTQIVVENIRKIKNHKYSYPNIFQTRKPNLKVLEQNLQSNKAMQLNYTMNSDRKSIQSPKFSAKNLTFSFPTKQQKQYYISQLTRAVNQKNSLAIEHVNSSIQTLKFCCNQQMPNGFQLQSRQIILEKHIKYKNKKTLLLDMDETLVHTHENHQAKNDVTLSFKTSPKNTVKIAVNIRPHALSFLRRMSKRFQIIVFTASHSNYANQILDYLDPNNEYIAHRLYRQHCTSLENGIHVKDLRLINRPLSQMILVDNAAYSYAFQLQNGIPIIPYYDGKDNQLLALQEYLQHLDGYSDVRQCNRQTFKLHHYIKFDNAVQLIQQLYMQHKH